MCGIAGYVGPFVPGKLKRMTDALRHRGPDDEGFFNRDDLHLGMRRLSIIDLTGGGQPQTNAAGTTVVFLNGEIYNYLELRSQLAGRGHRFKTDSSDTEVLVHLYDELGLAFVNELVGMFAICLLDTLKNEVYLIRDRLGKKPIHYAHDAGLGRLEYSSEFNGLTLAPDRASLDADSLAWYFSQKTMPQGGTIDVRIRTVPPGHFLRLRADRSIGLERYYDFGSNTRSSAPGTLEDAAKGVEALLLESVRLRMRADVEVGAFLSGGLDSSLITTMACRLSDRPLKTFCLVYDQEINLKSEDRRFARLVAGRCGTDHHEVLLTPELLTSSLPEIVAHYGQPNSAVIANWFISREMGKRLKVALSGDGADELFGSYFLHRFAARVSEGTDTPGTVGGDGDDVFYRENRAKPLAEVIDRFSVFTDRELALLLAPGLYAPGTILRRLEQRLGSLHSTDPLNRMLEFDCKNLLVEQVLNYSDTLSMAHSLEVRTPFLDHRLVELAFSLDHRFKIRDGQTKLLLKKVAGAYLPPELIHRKKEGFVEPAVQWIRNEMKDFCRHHLSAPDFNGLGLLNRGFVDGIVDEFYRTGDFYLGRKVWSLLIFAIWEKQRREGG